MILIKTPEEIQIMAEGGKLLSKIVKVLEKKIKPGIKTKELDRAIEALIFNCGGKPNFKGQDGYPAALCTSINEEIVHSVPSKRILKEGDIITLDCGLLWKSFHTDMAVTIPVGKISSQAEKLIQSTKEALKKGIKKVRPGNTFGDIGNAIQEYAESQGFNVVRELCGHGIGRNLHEDPQILNYGKKHSGLKIKEGMVFCIEPMLTAGNWKIKKGKDGYSYETKDGSLSAHSEHMMAVTKNGVKVLTVV